MLTCKKCDVEIKQVVTNGGELFFCSFRCRDEWFLEMAEKRVSDVQFQYDQVLKRTLEDVRGLIRNLSKEWKVCNTCLECGKIIREGLKYCGAACKQKVYRKRKAGNGGDDE